MLGLMQDQPLLISSLIEFAERHNGDAEIVSRRVEGDIHRSTWRQVAARARQVANALDARAAAVLRPRRHARLERLPPPGALLRRRAACGRVLHTINPRLHPDQIAWIANHAEDQVLCFDLTFLPLVAGRARRSCTTVRHWIALCDADKLPGRQRHPQPGELRGLDRAARRHLRLAQLRREHRRRACATRRGTTGNPKGALYSHRSTVLHAYAAALPDVDVPVGARLGAAGGADVPRQRLGHSVLGRADRRQAGVPGRRRSTASRCTSCSSPRGSPSPPACPPSGSCC